MNILLLGLKIISHISQLSPVQLFFFFSTHSLLPKIVG